ncbi:MAG TPA: adenylosuccinate synthase [Saprospiraceae bacterium]|nr:adenylosuccinate synthase [Saprospiraceae bacterium]MCC6688100.1 adenylosuccinate synthase [Saprospiraceae bacterium]HMV22744.1 adenylosuccinate synthase [Saprospiraceae bacterium]HMX81882.1 adenylosuccinate synthase [Saprospiraceae bacterium]HMX84312.1 adenylosuccinate synthase [Saprospiraceae bacterium]
MKVDVILGLQWGDEGKGKIVDFLAPQYDLVARFQGGPNAGHTLKFDNKQFVLHTIPSGIFRPGLINLIGNGVVIDPITLEREATTLDDAGIDYVSRLLISKKAHLILPSHRYLDAASELSKGKNKIGSTLKGIGPAYMDKTGRNGLRAGDIFSADFKDKYEILKKKHIDLLKSFPAVDFDLETEEKKWFSSIEFLKRFRFVNGEYYINEQLNQGKKILAEGAQGSMLDIDFGTYPFVTSSNTLTSGVCIGLGIAPSSIGDVIGITKAYCTRVGSGPFPTELDNEQGEWLRQKGGEFGATTGRARRCGWIDLVQLKYTIMLNGVTKLVMTKIDVLQGLEQIEVCDAYNIEGKVTTEIPYEINDVAIAPITKTYSGWQSSTAGIKEYEQLPQQAAAYIDTLEESLGIKFAMISTGPERESLIVK